MRPWAPLKLRPSPSLGRVTHWESERAFRADLDALGLARRGQGERDRVHVPDGVATYEDGHRVAVAAKWNLADALSAVTAHYAQSKTWIMPADVTAGIRASRETNPWVGIRWV